jgi:hypothetical protein
MAWRNSVQHRRNVEAADYAEKGDTSEDPSVGSALDEDDSLRTPRD